MQQTVPELTSDMRMEALRKANDIRSKRARFKAQMRAHRDGGGKQQALKLLTEVPTWAKTMKARDLLLAIPKIGKVKMRRLLSKADCSPSKTLGGLTPRQRESLRNQIEMI